MRLFDRFRREDPRIAEALALVEATRRESASRADELRREVTRLEGLLDAAGDPDAKLPGAQAQGLFRGIVQSGDPKDGPRDFPETKRNEIRRLSHLAYGLRGDAHNIVDILLDFVTGDDGIRPTATDADDTTLQDALDEVWSDPRNRLDARHGDMALTLFLDGERFCRAELNETDGRLELGWIPPEVVMSVQQDARGRDSWIIVRNPAAGREPLRFFVLDSLTENIRIHRVHGADENKRYVIAESSLDAAGVESIRTAECEGLVFAAFLNRPEGATRGRPELTEVLDYVDIHDEFLWTSLETTKLLRNLLIDVESKDITTEAEARAKLKELGLSTPPTGPKVLAHNDRVKVQVFAPEVKGNVTAELERVLALNIYGAKGMPEHWRGSGADANRATAAAQEAVPYKRLRRKQADVLAVFDRIVRVSLALRAAAGTLPAGIDPWSADFYMAVTEVGGRDRVRGTAIVKDLAASLGVLVGQNVLMREAANAIVVQALNEAGFTVPDEWTALPEEPEAAGGGLEKIVAALAIEGDARDDAPAAGRKDAARA